MEKLQDCTLVLQPETNGEREKRQGERPGGEEKGVSVEEAKLGFLLRQIYYPQGPTW